MNITYIWFCIYYTIDYVFVISYLSLACTSLCFEHNYIVNYYIRKVFTIFYYETLIHLIQNECIIDKHAVIYKYCFIIQCSYTNRSRLRWRTFVFNCNYMFVVVVFFKVLYNICLTFYLSNWKLTTRRSKFCFSIKVCIYLHLW